MNTHPGTKNKILILNLSIQINLVHLGLEYSFKSQFFAHLSSIFLKIKSRAKTVSNFNLSSRILSFCSSLNVAKDSSSSSMVNLMRSLMVVSSSLVATKVSQRLINSPMSLYLKHFYSSQICKCFFRFFLKNGQFPASWFFVFANAIQLTVIIPCKFCKWLDLNHGPPESKATAPPTESQSLP